MNTNINTIQSPSTKEVLTMKLVDFAETVNSDVNPFADIVWDAKDLELTELEEEAPFFPMSVPAVARQQLAPQKGHKAYINTPEAHFVLYRDQFKQIYKVKAIYGKDDIVTYDLESMGVTLSDCFYNGGYNVHGGYSGGFVGYLPKLSADALEHALPKMLHQDHLEACEVRRYRDDKWYVQETIQKVKELRAKFKTARFPTTKVEQVCLQYHGLQAYTQDQGPKDNLEGILQHDYVFCGSDKPIGSVGILFDGVVYQAYTDDVTSQYQQRSAVCKQSYVKEADWLDLAKTYEANDYRYMESWTQLDIIHGVWVSEYAYWKDILEAEAIAAQHNVPVFYGMPKSLGQFEDAQEAIKWFTTEAAKTVRPNEPAEGSYAPSIHWDDLDMFDTPF